MVGKPEMLTDGTSLAVESILAITMFLLWARALATFS